MIGSAGIVCSILNRRECLSHPNYRFLFVMSIIDIINSINLSVSSAAIPRGQYYGAIGNNMTCSTQGFLIQFGLAVPFYNASLSIFALLTICYNYRSEEFARVIEPVCHAVSLLFPLLTAIVLLALGLFHGGNKDGGGHWCWIYINESHQDMDKSREQMFSILLVMFAGIPVFALSLFVYYCMGSIYHHVRKQHANNRRHSFLGRGSNHLVAQRLSAARQALLYSGSFFFTHIFSHLSNMLQLAKIDEESNTYTSLLVLQSIFFPLQGLWNFFIYTSPIVADLNRHYPEMKMATAFRLAVFKPNYSTDGNGVSERRRAHQQRLSIKTAYKRQEQLKNDSSFLLKEVTDSENLFERMEEAQNITNEIGICDQDCFKASLDSVTLSLN